jgi:uncharacterized protein (TIGR00251 family)
MPGPPQCQIAVRVVPNARREGFDGWLGGALKIRLRAPALDGKANAALIDFLAHALDLPRRAITIARGEKSRSKSVAIAGLDEAALRARIGTLAQ